jgi:iron complex outermembrane receptor protein
VINVGKQWVGDPTTVTYFVLPGWTRVDAALYYRWHRFAFALNVQNVGDRRYIQSAQSAEYLVPGEQRKLTFSFDTKF